MSPARALRKQGKRVVRGVGRRVLPPSGPVVAKLVSSRVASDGATAPYFGEMTDEQARVHFGDEELIESGELQWVIRYFHAWRVRKLRERIGARLEAAEILDVGDTDGLMLKHLGKDRLGFNIAPAAIRNIESNGVEAKLGDGHALPFDNASFDYVLCFETLEHAESPHQLLLELARVCRPDGRVFVSIPWVPRTNVHERNLTINRGYGHVFELSFIDFTSLLTHTPLEVAHHDVCEVIGAPRGLQQRLFLLAHRRRHIVGDTFRRFNFFELAHRS